MDAITLAAVVSAGAIGAMMRHAVAGWWVQRTPTQPRDGVALINALGSFALGLLTVVAPSPDLRLIVGTGLLGGFTTFSTWLVWALDADRAGRDVLLHLGVGLPAAVVGLLVGGALL